MKQVDGVIDHDSMDPLSILILSIQMRSLHASHLCFQHSYRSFLALMYGTSLPAGLRSFGSTLLRSNVFSAQCAVRDLYGRQELGNFTEYFTAPILAHGAGVLKITPLRCAPESLCCRPLLLES